MKDLIARYDQGLRGRIQEIIAAVTRQRDRAAYVYDLSALKTLPPIMYPTTMINTALNYREHATEMAGLNSGPPALTAERRRPARRRRARRVRRASGSGRRPTARWNPYMFLKSPSAVIAHGEAIRLPPGRDQIDWECELGVVDRAVPLRGCRWLARTTTSSDTRLKTMCPTAAAAATIGMVRTG